MFSIEKMYVYGQDGEPVDQNIIEFFGLTIKDLKYDRNTNTSYFDFVGFVFNKEKILVVFPKHYYNSSDLFSFNLLGTELKDEIKMLYDSMQKYASNPRSVAKADNYIGSKTEFESDYPFSSFYKVYDYFRKYGLYKEQEEIVNEGFHGKISWKKTIKKSNIIVSDDNLIFMPLYVKKNNILTGFITDCMAFVIDYTITHFNDFISLPRTHHRKNKFEYFNNIDYVIKKLNELKRYVHKDSERILIDNLIHFFTEYRTKCTGGNIHVKVNYFEHIWQSAVNEYLNKYYDSFDSTRNMIVFDKGRTTSYVAFQKKSFNVDKSRNNFKIDLDHYAFDGATLYIFDSKYYFKLDEFNYKQYSYNELLRYSESTISNIVSILILPGTKASDKHFDLETTFIGARTYGNTIFEQYIEVEDVLKNYIG